MKKPFISIVLPVYNVETYLEECLDSLLNQTIGYENLQVIMVNDCSTDGSAKIIDYYAEKYENFTAIHMEKNSGAPGAPRNIGIDCAKGKYIIFADPDDIIPHDAYQSLYEVAKKYKSDFVMGKMVSFDDVDGREFEHGTFKHFLLQKHYFNVNIDSVPHFLQTKTSITLKLVKTELIKRHNIKFIEGMKNGEDKFYDMSLFTKAKKFSYIPKVIYRYRSRNDEKNLSMTQRDVISTVENDVKAAEYIKLRISDSHYKYFQINAFRSLLWKICNPDFNVLSDNEKLYVINLITKTVKNYDPELVNKYFPLEGPFLSLIDKGFINEALEYNKILISRRWWYKQGIDFQSKYKKQKKIRDSLSWRLTKTLRNKDFKLKNILKRGQSINEGNYSNSISQ